ncbi:MAG: hypothetical protein GY930_12755 [bacterium]|nr:hypothetical protein [bacterium]
MDTHIEPWARQGIETLKKELGWVVTYELDDSKQPYVSIEEGSNSWSFRMLCVRQLRPATASHRIREQLSGIPDSQAGEPVLLVTERVSESVAEILRGQEVSYVDMGGNAHISRKGLHIWVSGRPVATEAARVQKTTTPVALQLAFLLLQDAQLCARPYRELARQSGLALGSVGWIMTAFIRAGYVGRRGRNRFLRSPKELATHFEQHWHERLRPKLGEVICQGPADLGFKRLLKTCAANQGFLVGGELAASQILGGVEPSTATIHVPVNSVQESMGKLRLLKNPAGNIRLLESFGSTHAWHVGKKTHPQKVSMADPLLIRAELLESQDARLHELAEELLTQHIAPRWES